MMMTERRRLTIVTGAFVITGRGTVLVIEMPEGDDWRLVNGQSIVLKLPDGVVISTMIDAIEFVDPGGSLALVIGNDLKPENVPIGTQVWIEA
jgi:hypothetical protein